MNRRLFLKMAAGCLLHAGFGSVAGAHRFVFPGRRPQTIPDRAIRDYLSKMRRFDSYHADDICLIPKHLPLLRTARDRLRRLQQTVGHGNFYLLNFDEALKIAKNYARVGPFTADELNFLEMIFYADGARYGFLGDKPFKNLTDRVIRRKVIKIPHTGNYLYRGKPVELYDKIRNDVGHQVVLTSGIRSVIKQFMLFLDKACRHQGNLSLASRSLAPPGYSYHGIGDFDVGQIGLGAANFTESFTATPVFQRLNHLGYIDLRYRKNNLLGVRFEPWHIQVYPDSSNRSPAGRSQDVKA